MIHLKTLNKKGLEDFVASGEFQHHDFIPITKHRAESHIRNPKATDDQTLLILAYDEDQLAGYVGCLPDHFKIDGEIFRYAWLSTLFISDQFRGKKIAQTLLNKAFEEYQGNIALTEFTKEAESLYNKTGLFRYIEPKKGKKYYFRTDLEIIIPLKREKTKPLQPLFKITDSIINTVISTKNIFIKKPDFKFEILDTIDVESKNFIAKFKNNRTAEEINWAIENPWVLEGKTEDKKYLFSSYSQNFRYFWVKIFDKDRNLNICSLLMLRNGHLKIPYLFSESDLSPFLDFLSYFIARNKIKMMTSYQIDLNKKIDSYPSFPKIYQRNIERRYMFHQNLIQNLPEHFNPDFQDGDGDCLMT
ncbi:GNAT family N-acetyltransferase [Chryseobacterium chendengshani]|uniref:GNAT family N-acetyltransferase n=1 Tax=Chryseobacterium sp. LJ668 TaxID=2864040 RepID=UPI001C68ECD0|nr:GNAT family N-acetyltransferase [Chryseobacterium sp. LJ668]MBW8524051.1 GNAT family N-acetyltransferase [Chryseobacterium sp. LJ668]QYK16987.1 GNAT family N-acetyltransferase [Chryseobacterium sp. LJ668]